MQEDFASTVDGVSAAIQSVIEGNADVVRLVLTVLLAEGHVLIGDVPGVGKTMLAQAPARSVDCSVSRIHFTPDLLSGDITGGSAYVQETRRFGFKPGPTRGSGLAGLTDRVAATGGTLTVHSRRGQGTRLVAKLPGRPGEPVSHLPGDPGKGG